jgi:hypothetical protein
MHTVLPKKKLSGNIGRGNVEYRGMSCYDGIGNVTNDNHKIVGRAW